MFAKKTNFEETAALDAAILAALTELPSLTADSDEYSKTVEQLDKLYKLRYSEKKNWAVSPDTAAVVFGNLAGIVMILGFERAHVITTKALSFVMKSKL